MPRTDALGSIVKTTDSAGNPSSEVQYDAFGNVQGLGGSAFTGREWDDETGLYYYRARYYDPKIGRFLSEDPIGFAGGDVNLYAYVWNNPTRYLDPFGLEVINRSGKTIIVKPETGGPGTVPADSTYPGKIDGVMGPDGKWMKFEGKEWLPDNKVEVTKDGEVKCVGLWCRLLPPEKLDKDPDEGWKVPEKPKELPGCKRNK
jgi:RHS repeat-associated protein